MNVLHILLTTVGPDFWDPSHLDLVLQIRRGISSHLNILRGTLPSAQASLLGVRRCPGTPGLSV